MPLRVPLAALKVEDAEPSPKRLTVPVDQLQPADAPDRSWGDTAVDLVKGAGAGLASTVFGGGDLIRRGLGMERVIDTPDVKAAMTPPESTPGKLGYQVEQIGEFFLPTGMAGKAGKVAEVLKSGALTAAQTGGNPTAIGVSAGLSAIPGEAIAQKIGGALKSSALETMAGSLKATKEWAKAESDRLAPEMLKRGVGGSIKALRTLSSEMAAKVGKNLDDAYRTAAQAGETVPVDIVRGNIQLASDALHSLAPDGYTQIVNPAHKEAIAALHELDEFVGKHGTSLPVDKAAALKRSFDAVVSKAGLYGQNAMAPASDKAKAFAFREAANSFRDLLNNNPTVEALNKEASFWIGLRNVVDATKLRKVGQTGGLIAAGTGGAGAVAGALSGDSASERATNALLGGLAGRQLVRVLQSPAYMNRVSAPMKDALAEALASGSVGRLNSVTSRIAAGLPSQLSPRVAP